MTHPGFPAMTIAMPSTPTRALTTAYAEAMAGGVTAGTSARPM